MRNVSIRRPKLNRKAAGRSHYEALRRPDLERHPVDTAVEARLFHRAVRRRVIQLQERIKGALGADAPSFLQLDALLNDEGIIRNRLKINSAVTNAIAFLEVKREFGSFDTYVWRFVNGKPLRRKRGQPLAARTEISDALSKDLLKRGFKFVGSTICYSFMQAVGMVNDHDSTCFRYREV